MVGRPEPHDEAQVGAQHRPDGHRDKLHSGLIVPCYNNTRVGSSDDLSVNGRSYRRPAQPTVVFTIDGGDPRYLDDALSRGLMPALAGVIAGGAYARGRGCMPSLTNPNNLAIVTGVP